MNKQSSCAFAITFLLISGLQAQQKKSEGPNDRKFGIKTGLNFIDIRNAQSIKGGNRNGFMAGVFFAPKPKGIWGSRSEILYSRQGYHFNKIATTGSVGLDYILLPQLVTIDLTKYVQLQAGGQFGILLHSKVDSLSSLSTVPTAGPSAYFNKFQYGFAGGLELYPVSCLLLGGRLNININTLNKDQPPGRLPSYIPTDGSSLRSNVVQLYVGFRF